MAYALRYTSRDKRITAPQRVKALLLAERCLRATPANRADLHRRGSLWFRNYRDGLSQLSSYETAVRQ